MRVTIVGASGRTGRLVVDRALAAGHEVTAVSRSGAVPGDVRADVLDPAALRTAVADSDVVVSTIAPPLRDLLRPTTLYSTGTANLIDAMREHGVARLVAVSSAGVLDGDPSHPWLYRRVLKPLLFDRGLYRDMRVMEREVENSGLRWVIVRAAGLTNGAATGTYRVEDGRLPAGGTRISRADLATFLVTQLPADAEYTGRHPTLAY
nr:TamE [uncultured bacterium]